MSHYAVVAGAESSPVTPARSEHHRDARVVQGRQPLRRSWSNARLRRLRVHGDHRVQCRPSPFPPRRRWRAARDLTS